MFNGQDDLLVSPVAIDFYFLVFAENQRQCHQH